MQKLISVGKYYDPVLSITIVFYINPNTPNSCVIFPDGDTLDTVIEIGYQPDTTWIEVFDNIQHELEELYYRMDKRIFTYLDNPTNGVTSLLFVFSHDVFHETRLRASHAYCAVEDSLKRCFNKLKKVHKKNAT